MQAHLGRPERVARLQGRGDPDERAADLDDGVLEEPEAAARRHVLARLEPFGEPGREQPEDESHDSGASATSRVGSRSLSPRATTHNANRE